MTAARTFLLGALQRVADGGDIDGMELEAAVPDPHSLDRHEKSAWKELRHWADDTDIRERDERYAAFKHDWMRDCIAKLIAHGS